MNLFKRGATIIVIVALVLFFSGCVENTPAAITPAPGAQAIPIPITGNYMANGSINADKLATNVIPYNVTVNTTAGAVTGTIFLPLNNNGSITVNRTSFVVVQWSGEIGVNGTNSSYMLITLGGVNMTASPVKIGVNNDTASSYSDSGSKTILMYNASVPVGTYKIVPYANASTANAVVTYGRNILLTMAYPHS